MLEIGLILKIYDSYADFEGEEKERDLTILKVADRHCG